MIAFAQRRQSPTDTQFVESDARSRHRGTKFTSVPMVTSRSHAQMLTCPSVLTGLGQDACSDPEAYGTSGVGVTRFTRLSDEARIAFWNKSMYHCAPVHEQIYQRVDLHRPPIPLHNYPLRLDSTTRVDAVPLGAVRRWLERRHYLVFPFETSCQRQRHASGTMSL